MTHTPHTEAIEAQLAEAGIPVMDLDAWAATHAPGWLAEAEARSGTPHISRRAETEPRLETHD